MLGLKRVKEVRSGHEIGELNSRLAPSAARRRDRRAEEAKRTRRLALHDLNLRYLKPHLRLILMLLLRTCRTVLWTRVYHARRLIVRADRSRVLALHR